MTSVFDCGTPWRYLSRSMTKPKVTVRPAKTQISLCMLSLLCSFLICHLCVVWDILQIKFVLCYVMASAHPRMPRLIWVFARRTCHFVGFVMLRPIFIGFLMTIPTLSESVVWCFLPHRFPFVSLFFLYSFAIKRSYQDYSIKHFSWHCVKEFQSIGWAP